MSKETSKSVSQPGFTNYGQSRNSILVNGMTPNGLGSASPMNLNGQINDIANNSTGFQSKKRTNRRKAVSVKSAEDKFISKAMRIVFKNSDTYRLTDDAIEACNDLKIAPVTLINQNLDFFQKKPTSLSPKKLCHRHANYHAENTEAELAEVRYNHYQLKRKQNLKKVFDYIMAKKQIQNNEKDSPAKMKSTNISPVHKPKIVANHNSCFNQSIREETGKNQVRDQLTNIVENLPQIKSKHDREAQSVKIGLNQTRHGREFNSISSSNAGIKAKAAPQYGHSPSRTKNSTMAGTFDSKIHNKGVLGGKASYFYTPTENAFQPLKQLGVGIEKEVRAFHMTQPDGRLSKALFSQQQTSRPAAVFTQGVILSPKKGHTWQKSPKSVPTESVAGLLINQDNPVPSNAASMPTKDQNGTVLKAKKLVDREVDRVEKMKRARESALQQAKELRAKQILKDKIEEERERKYKEMLEDEAESRAMRFSTEAEKRKNAATRVHNKQVQLDELGFKSYKEYLKEVEETREKVKLQELEAAEASFLNLQKHMDNRAKKRQDLINKLDQEAEVANTQLQNITEDINKKSFRQQQTIEETKKKCQDMFAVQRNNYEKYSSIKREQLFNQSAKVVNKFNLQRKKEREIKESQDASTHDLKTKNMERFQQCDDIMNKVRINKSLTDRATIERADYKEQVRDSLLSQRELQHQKKIEMTKLKTEDVKNNQVAERSKKQDFQDYLLRKEFQKNAFNSEAHVTTNQWVSDTKKQTQSVERTKLDSTHTHRALVRRKEDSILNEVKVSTIQKLSDYRQQGNDRKYKDFCKLMKLMGITNVVKDQEIQALTKQGGDNSQLNLALQKTMTSIK